MTKATKSKGVASPKPAKGAKTGPGKAIKVPASAGKLVLPIKPSLAAAKRRLTLLNKAYSSMSYYADERTAIREMAQEQAALVKAIRTGKFASIETGRTDHDD